MFYLFPHTYTHFQHLLGIILEYTEGKTGQAVHKTLDLLDLSPQTDLDALADIIISQEPMIRPKRKPRIIAILENLVEKLQSGNDSKFVLKNDLHAHILPLTNCAFNKSGSKFITGSYDRTCRVWDTASGECLLKLDGHMNVVYAIAFNNPFGDKIITGSFDKTCRLWDANTGECLHVLKGHQKEIVCVAFDPQGDTVASGSTDHTVKLWNANTGELQADLVGHSAEVHISIHGLFTLYHYNLDTTVILSVYGYDSYIYIYLGGFNAL